MSVITVEVSARTDVGNEREHNEDNFLVADLTARTRTLADGATPIGKRGIALAVCDGMGGAAAGEVASELAVSNIFQHLTSVQEAATTRDDLAKRLEEAAQIASEKIHEDATRNVARAGMGTTLTGVALVDDHLIFVQVGDSRGYLLRQGKLTQVTRDQSLVAKLVERGALTEEQALTFEHSNIILQALGASTNVVVDLTQVELRRGDRLLLCSDGLSGLVPDEEIRALLADDRDPTSVSIQLVERAKELGGHDNVTAIVAFFSGPGLHADYEPVEVHRYGGGTELLAIPDPRRLGELLQLPIESSGTAVLTSVVSEPLPPLSSPPAPAPASVKPAGTGAPDDVDAAAARAQAPPRATEAEIAETIGAALASLPESLPAIPPQAPVPIFAPPSNSEEEPAADAVEVTATASTSARPSIPRASMPPTTSGSRNTLIVAAALLAAAILGGSAVFVLADSRAATTIPVKPQPPGEPRSGEPESTWVALDTPSVGSYATPAAQPSGSSATPAPTAARTEPRTNVASRGDSPRPPAAAPAPKPPSTAASSKKGELAPQRDDE